MLWSLPARLLPKSLWTYHALHCAYLAGGGCLAFWLWRRLFPDRPLLAWLAGLFAAIWSPLDFHRLNVVQPYASYTFFAMLAIVLFVEAWLRERPALLWLAALIAFLDVRAYEASGSLLLGAPLCVLWTRTRPSRPWSWIAAWVAAVVFSLALAALPLLLPRTFAYQQAVLGGVDLVPLHVLERLVAQYRFHLLPVVATPLSELAVMAVPVALAVFGVACWPTLRAKAPEHATRRELLGLMLLGLALAGLGYGVLVANKGLVEPARTQFLSAPGIGLFLASSFTLLASPLPRRFRGPAVALLGAWVVAVGAARTVALQRFWDGVSVHAAQAGLLQKLVGAAPRLKPNTFVILLDDAGSFENTIAFRHALLYLYPGEATGFAWGKWSFLFDMYLTPAGVVSQPWPVIRQAWRAPVTGHLYEELLVVRQTERGEVQLLGDWPAGRLPPLPPGARYEPRGRIATGPPPAQRRVLRELLR
jgi:hypothetical protein